MTVVVRFDTKTAGFPLTLGGQALSAYARLRIGGITSSGSGETYGLSRVRSA